jgi:hypothetical protein
MRPIIEKVEPNGPTAKLTSGRGVQGSPKMTARMHFYAVRSAGDQLRWDSAPLASKKPDRMVGR